MAENNRKPVDIDSPLEMNEIEKKRVGNPAHDIKKLVEVRHTRLSDLDAVMDVFCHARERMREAGNHSQWINGYPSARVAVKDIEEGNSYLIESDKGILGVFTFIVGEDPTYGTIDGEWPDSEPYGTIHRIASAPCGKGVADIALDFCKRAGVNIRVDTHADNAPMIGWIAKRGFSYCGIIHIEDGTPRKAFQLSTDRF